MTSDFTSAQLFEAKAQAFHHAGAKAFGGHVEMATMRFASATASDV